jgi:hypothetical protein
MSYKNYVQPGLKLRPRTAPRWERKIHCLLITLSLLGRVSYSGPRQVFC